MTRANRRRRYGKSRFWLLSLFSPKEQSMPWITVQLLAAGPPSALGSGDPRHPKHI
ncbi:MAG: hypothetical protein ABJB04_03285 [Betaproteobacteria bacterium]